MTEEENLTFSQYPSEMPVDGSEVNYFKPPVGGRDRLIGAESLSQVPPPVSSCSPDDSDSENEIYDRDPAPNPVPVVRVPDMPEGVKSLAQIPTPDSSDSAGRLSGDSDPANEPHDSAKNDALDITSLGDVPANVEDDTNESSPASNEGTASDSASVPSKDDANESSPASNEGTVSDSASAPSKDDANESSSASTEGTASDSASVPSKDDANESSSASTEGTASDSASVPSKDDANESSSASNEDTVSDTSPAPGKDDTSESSKDDASSSSSSSLSSSSSSSSPSSSVHPSAYSDSVVTVGAESSESDSSGQLIEVKLPATGNEKMECVRLSSADNDALMDPSIDYHYRIPPEEKSAIEKESYLLINSDEESESESDFRPVQPKCDITRELFEQELERARVDTEEKYAFCEEHLRRGEQRLNDLEARVLDIDQRETVGRLGQVVQAIDERASEERMNRLEEENRAMAETIQALEARIKKLEELVLANNSSPRPAVVPSVPVQQPEPQPQPQPQPQPEPQPCLISSSSSSIPLYTLKDYEEGRFPTNGDPMLLDDAAFKAKMNVTKSEFLALKKVKQWQKKAKFWSELCHK